MIRDFYRGSNTFDVDAKEQIAKSTNIPIQYMSLDSKFVSPAAAVEINAFMSKLSDPFRQCVGLTTHTTVDGTETYGYEIDTNLIPYTGLEPFEGIFGEEPETLRDLRESGIQMFLCSVYFLEDGTPKYFGLKMKTKHLPVIEPLLKLENFHSIRESLLKSTTVFHARYWFDLTNHDNISVSVVDQLPPRLRSLDVYEKVTEETHRQNKVKYYQAMCDNNAISQEDCDYILENSPRMQKTMIKWLWSSNSIVKRELESICVHDFEDV